MGAGPNTQLGSLQSACLILGLIGYQMGGKEESIPVEQCCKFLY